MGRLENRGVGQRERLCDPFDVVVGVFGIGLPSQTDHRLAALDATVIRMMLVPSVLGMLGARAWWIPSWLDARLPRVEFSH